MDKCCFAYAKSTRNESRAHQYSHEIRGFAMTEQWLIEKKTIQRIQPHTISPHLVPPTLCNPTWCTPTLCRPAGARTRWHKVWANWQTAIDMELLAFTVFKWTPSPLDPKSNFRHILCRIPKGALLRPFDIAKNKTRLSARGD